MSKKPHRMIFISHCLVERIKKFLDLDFEPVIVPAMKISFWNTLFKAQSERVGLPLNAFNRFERNQLRLFGIQKTAIINYTMADNRRREM